MIIVRMECEHTCEIDIHKRQADRTLLFEYICLFLRFCLIIEIHMICIVFVLQVFKFTDL